MSGSAVCACSKEFRRVSAYHQNASAFNGYRRTPSRYSEIICVCCGNRYRTKAAYVATLSSIKHEEIERLVPDWSKCPHMKHVALQKPSAPWLQPKWVPVQ